MAKQRLAAPPRQGACGHPYVTGARQTPSVGGEKEGAEGPAFLQLAHLGPEWMQKPGVTDELNSPVLLPLPSLASSLLVRPHAPFAWGELLLSDGRRGGREWSYRFPPPDAAVCLPRRQPLGTDDSLVFMVLLKALHYLSAVFSYYINM